MCLNKVISLSLSLSLLLFLRKSLPANSNTLRQIVNTLRHKVISKHTI